MEKTVKSFLLLYRLHLISRIVIIYYRAGKVRNDFSILVQKKNSVCHEYQKDGKIFSRFNDANNADGLDAKKSHE